MTNINNADLEKVSNYLNENYKTQYEWINNNAGTCNKYGLTNEEFLEIIAFELANNQAAPVAWKEILSTSVGLKDGVERTVIKDFCEEKIFSAEEIFDATMYASHTFSKHAVKNSHREVIEYRFALYKHFSKTSETDEVNKKTAKLLKDINVPESNIIYSFLEDKNLSLEEASIKFKISEEEIEKQISEVFSVIINRQHPLFDKTIFDEMSTKDAASDRIDITHNVLCLMSMLKGLEKTVIGYLFGVPEGLSEQELENGSNIKLEIPHTFGEASSKFDITVEKVLQIVLNINMRLSMERKKDCPPRRKKLREYLDD